MLDATADALVVGAPGAGKSTMILRVAHEGARAWRDGMPEAGSPYRHAMPMLADITTLAEAGVAAALADFCERDLKVVMPREVFGQRPTPKSRWLVLVDGLDEVLDQQERSRLLHGLAAVIGDATSPYRFLIATRPLDHAELAELRGKGIGDYELRIFEPGDLSEFTRKWFAARLPGEDEAVDAASALFLDRVRDAQLEPIVRIPLLATIAALVYEKDSGAALPTSRTGLYDRFVENLLRSRAAATIDPQAVRAATGGQEEAAKRLLRWLEVNVLALLERVSFARIWDGDTRPIVTLALEAGESMSGIASIGIAGWWEGRVRDALFSSGVLVRGRTDATFLHQSIGEFLAAGPLAAAPGDPDWAGWLTLPSTRSTALFALARSRRPLEPIVRDLIGGGQALLAGYILTDGAVLDEETRAQVTAGLLERIDHDSPDAVECLSQLESLSWRPEVRAAALIFVTHPGRGYAARASVCDTLAPVMPDELTPIVRSLARDRKAPYEVRTWMLDRLAALGDESERLLAPFRPDAGDERPTDARPSALRLHALKTAAVDDRRSEMDRTKAAAALLRAGDPAGRRMLLILARSAADPAAQSLAASILLDNVEALDLAFLLHLVEGTGITVAVRHRLLERLAALGGPEASGRLGALVKDLGTNEQEQQVALDGLMRTGDEPALRELTALRDTARLNLANRIEVSKYLAVRGVVAGADTLGRLAVDKKLSANDRWFAFAALASTPDTAMTAPAVREVLRRTQDPSVRNQMAMVLVDNHSDTALELVLPNVLNVRASIPERVMAIRQLREIGTPAATRALETLVRQRDAPYLIRETAFQTIVGGLSEFSDPVRLLPDIIAAAPNGLMLQASVSSAVAASEDLRRWVRNSFADAEWGHAARSVFAFALAEVSAQPELEPAIAIVEDGAFPAETRVMAAQRVLDGDAQRGLDLIVAMLVEAEVPFDQQEILLNLLIRHYVSHGGTALRGIAGSRAADPRCRLRAAEECRSEEGISADLADLVVEERLDLASRVHAARLLAEQHTREAGTLGLRLGTEPWLEVPCRAWALVAAGKAHFQDGPWHAAVTDAVTDADCPGDVKLNLIDLLQQSDRTESTEVLLTLGDNAELDPAARVYVGLALLTGHPGDALRVLSSARAGGHLPDWLATIADDTIDEYSGDEGGEAV